MYILVVAFTIGKFNLNLIAGVLGWLPEFSNQFSIVDFSDEFRSVLIQVRKHLEFSCDLKC